MSHFRIGVGRIIHEGNSFVSRETPLSDFETFGGISLGSEVLGHPERRDEVAGFVERFARAGEDVELVPLLSTGGFASGNVSGEAVLYLDETLRGKLHEAGELDGILFALHGAMTSGPVPDLDGHFLEIIRQEIGSKIPLVCTLDCHANVSQRMIDLATALVAYRTHPHVDIVETGSRAADIMWRTLRGEIDPVMVWRKIPMVFPPPDDGTRSGPLKELFDTFIAWDDLNGVVAGSLCCCQAWLDVPELGLAAVAVTDHDYSLGTRLVHQLAAQVWAVREGLMPERMLSPEVAVGAAAATPGHPIIITDSADTVGGGAPGDTPTLLRALLDHREKVDGLILAHVPDPEAVRQVLSAGQGNTLTLEVGGKRDPRYGQPVTVTGRILRITDGVIADVGEFTPEPFVDAGATACLAIDNVRLVLTEQVITGPQPSLFRKVGIEPFEAKIVALKTGIGFKVTYDSAEAVFRADCPGTSSYNLNSYDFTRIPRPLYPLDPNMDWEPEA